MNDFAYFQLFCISSGTKITTTTNICQWQSPRVLIAYTYPFPNFKEHYRWSFEKDK